MAHNPRLAWSLTLCGALTASVLAQQSQQAPTPTPQGVITGTVVDGSTGEAVAGALVYLTGVDLRPLPAGQTRQVTDARGRFAFVNLTGDSTYLVSASKFGYLDGGYGRDHAPTDPLRPILLKNDEWVSNVRITVWKAGSISGLVRDEAGEPVVGVFVRVLARFRIQGRDDLVAGPVTTTDDRGEYRIPGLAPGRYVVQVPSVQSAVPASTALPAFGGGNAPAGVLDVDDTQRLVIGRYPLPPPPVSGRPMTYPVMFHPSSPVAAQATFIDLKYGDERSSVDLTLTPVPSVRVSGIVEGPPEGMKQLTLRLLPTGLENLGFGAEVATALVAGDGRFTFLNVPAGSYTIDAPVRVRELTTVSTSINRPNVTRLPNPPPAQGSGYSSNSIDLFPGLQFMDMSFRQSPGEFSGRSSVTVGGSDLSGVVVRLRPHLTMSGRVVIEPDPNKKDKPPASVPIRLDPAAAEASLGSPSRSLQQQTSPDTFIIPGIQPGLYFLRTFGSPSWITKSITWKGRDYTHVPFDLTAADDFSDVTVTITNATPELSGSVTGSTDIKPERSIVVAFPAERAQWMNTGFNPSRMKYSPVSNNGTYRFSTLPAGNYLIAAIDRALLGSWRETEFLARLERQASRISLSWGVRTSQDLTTVTVK